MPLCHEEQDKAAGGAIKDEGAVDAFATGGTFKAEAMGDAVDTITP